jgi:hypothetical protein
MPLNILGLVTGIAVARREGVEGSQLARVALPAAVLPNIALGVVVVDRLAQQEAATEAAQAATALPSSGTTRPALVSSSAVQAGAGTSGAGTSSGTFPAATGPLPQPASLPSVSPAPPPPPTYKVGDVLQADPGMWQGIPAGENPKFQWFRIGAAEPEDIDRATSAQYKITKEDNDHWLTVQVTYDGVSTMSPPVPVGTPPPGKGESPATSGAGASTPK